MTQKVVEQCRDLRTLGTATPEQLARLAPGGDLYAEFGAGYPHEIVNGNICELGKETRTVLVPNYVDQPATPGGWFLHHAGGGVSRIVNPDPSWGAPGSATSRGTVTLTGRKDDRTLPWALELDAGTPTGSLYFEPVAPDQAVERSEVGYLDPESERVAELRAEQAAREAELRAELEARRAAEAAASEKDGEPLDFPSTDAGQGGALGPAGRAGGGFPLWPVALGALLLLGGGRRR